MDKKKMDDPIYTLRNPLGLKGVGEEIRKADQKLL